MLSRSSRTLVALAVASSTLLAAIPAGAQETAASWVDATAASGFTNPVVGDQATATYQYDANKKPQSAGSNVRIVLKTKGDDQVSTLEHFLMYHANQDLVDQLFKQQVKDFELNEQQQKQQAEQFNGSEAYKATVAAVYWTHALWAKHATQLRQAEKFHCVAAVAADPACAEQTFTDFARVMQERSKAFGLTGFKGTAGQTDFEAESKWVIKNNSGGYELFNLAMTEDTDPNFHPYVVYDFPAYPDGYNYHSQVENLLPGIKDTDGPLTTFTTVADWEQLQQQWNADFGNSYTQEDREKTPKWFRARLWQLNYEFTKLKGDADPMKAAYAEAWQNMLPALQTALVVSNRPEGDPGYDLFTVQKAEKALMLFAAGYRKLGLGELESYNEAQLDEAIKAGRMGDSYTPEQMDASNTYPSPVKTIDQALNEGSSKMSTGQMIALIVAILAVLGALAAAATQAFPPAAAPAPAAKP